MAIKYKIEQLKPLTVRLHQPRPHLGTTPVWAPAWQEISEDQAAEITAYVEAHELGRRTAHDIWQLKNPQAMTLFMLQYG
jgi:hypothetical protein